MQIVDLKAVSILYFQKVKPKPIIPKLNSINPSDYIDSKDIVFDVFLLMISDIYIYI